MSSHAYHEVWSALHAREQSNAEGGEAVSMLTLSTLYVRPAARIRHLSYLSISHMLDTSPILKRARS